MKFSYIWFIVIILAALVLCPVAVGQDDEEEPAPGADILEGEAGEPTPVPGDISAEFRISGASHLQPLAQAIISRFNANYPNVSITLNTSGTPAGFRSFCDEESFFNHATRPILESEATQCEENGVEWAELLVGYEGVVLAAHPDVAEFAACLNAGPLAIIWRAASEPSPEFDAEEGEGEEVELPEPRPGITNWNEVDPNFPDLPLLLYGDRPATAPGDMLSRFATGTAGDLRTDYTANANYQALVDEMVGKPGALGFFDFDYFGLEEDELVLVQVGADCAAPDEAAITGGAYPLARPLYLYINTAQLEQPAIQAFMDLYLEQAGDVLRERGFYPAPEDVYAQGRALIAERTTGRTFTEPPPEPDPIVIETSKAEEDTATEEAEAEEAAATEEAETEEDEAGADE